MKKPTIYISRKIPTYLTAAYEDELHFEMWPEAETPIPRDVLSDKVRQADGLICLLTEKIDLAFIQDAAHLKIIANMAVGYDNIDVLAAQENNIIVTNTPDVLTETTADLTFGLLMATARRLVEASRIIYENKWGDWAPFSLAGTDIHDKTIGIVGMGRIGEAVARRAKGFNMDILYHNRNRNEAAERALGATYVSFDSLLEKADYVVSLLPLTTETEGTFNEAAFEKMKKSAIFINASRGGVVDEEALFQALKTKQITAAGLDVFQHEPISSDHPLTKLSNAVLLPHIGSATVATRENMLTLCLENVAEVFRGNKPKTPVY